MNPVTVTIVAIVLSALFIGYFLESIIARIRGNKLSRPIYFIGDFTYIALLVVLIFLLRHVLTILK